MLSNLIQFGDLAEGMVAMGFYKKVQAFPHDQAVQRHFVALSALQILLLKKKEEIGHVTCILDLLHCSAFLWVLVDGYTHALEMSASICIQNCAWRASS